MRGLAMASLTWVMACGGDGPGGSASASSGPQPTSVSESQSAGSEAASSSGSQLTGTDADPTTGAASTPTTDPGASETGTTTGPGDPSVGDTGYQTDGFDDCVKSLPATIRDFRAEHPDFEDYTSDTGLKGLVNSALGPDDKPVHAAAGPTEQTAGPDSYAQWYNNAPDVNIAFAIEIPLTEVTPGLYSFESDAFFPVDDQGWGNEGNPHNFHFTSEIHTEFNYHGGEVFTFIGDDDLWLFINGVLAIDLGGVHPELTGSVDLDAEADALGIAVGGVYSMDIFHAERHTVDSHFRIDTSIQCFVAPG
jgi:fibro-slime domain-containing protein